MICCHDGKHQAWKFWTFPRQPLSISNYALTSGLMKKKQPQIEPIIDRVIEWLKSALNRNTETKFYTNYYISPVDKWCSTGFSKIEFTDIKVNCIDCYCMNPPFYFRKYQVIGYLGQDTTNGRFADVEIQECKCCGSLWLHYHVTYEAFTKSWRWYKSLISEEIKDQVTAYNAAIILERLTTRFEGRSFFESSGRMSEGPLKLGVFG